MINNYPAASDIVNASATSTTAGLVTVPAGRWLTANIVLSGNIVGAGPATPRVTYTVPGGSGGAPGTGAVLHQLSLGGVVGVASQDSATMEIDVYGGSSGAGCTLDFNTGGASNASVVINGFLI